ncbi:nitrous oxide-stimulated promoter family protein [uncultured Clostridium sp.]|uniref:nitrous oxide-stimulated promoter family protein n=1 Tax=uncultured Clostridium sp. TaxID=59620 RepID=UPI002606E1AC|nr:nitrous oxide-stimulated promoter family protein [uncultured Clostridium sp.]
MGRIEREKKTIALMIDIYCQRKHGNKKGELCDECKELLEYAHKRLSFCKFGENKSTCSRCPIHCYKKDMKEKVKDVMKFSGPRLIVHNPIELVRHALNK